MIRNLYRITTQSVSDKGKGTFEVKLNTGSDIFRGHFPGHPVLPGVCSIDIVKECVSMMCGYNVIFYGISLCKFTGMVDPQIEDVLKVDIEIIKGEKEGVNAIVSASQRIVLKLKGVFKETGNGK